MEQRENMQRVQGLMVILGSFANALEVLLGRGSEGVSRRAGRKVGLSAPVKKTAKGDLLKALDLVQEEMRALGMNWPVRAYKKSTETELVTDNQGVKELKLAIENCLVRCTLSRYGFPQRGSLCNTKHGVFCGLFDQIYGSKSTMSIIHAGENGCMLKLHIRG